MATPPLKAVCGLFAALKDQQLLGAVRRDPKKWAKWDVFLHALFGESLLGPERAIFEKFTGRTQPSKAMHREAYVIVGRRGGKSSVLALVATYLACFVDWTPYLSPGEYGTIMIIAADRKQARTIFNYIKGFINASSWLSRKVKGETTSTITLDNWVQIEIHTASFRAVRSYTCIAALLDEAAFWRTDDSANPDVEIMKALRPAMASIPHAMLLCASSPFARRGIVYKAFRDHYGKNGDSTLVWRADTLSMNPTISEERVKKEYEDDFESARVEYGAEFRADVEIPITPEMVEGLTAVGCEMRLPEAGVQYTAFVDPSGGSSDYMALAVAHFDVHTGIAVLDRAEWRKPPFSPEVVSKEFATIIKSYGINWCYGDAYAGVWPQERFSVHQISYTVSEKTKADIYSEFLPMINARRVEFLDLKIIGAQLTLLERRPSRTGRIVFDHPTNAHDDVANVVAGALIYCAQAFNIVIDDTTAIVGDPLASSTADFGREPSRYPGD